MPRHHNLTHDTALDPNFQAYGAIMEKIKHLLFGLIVVGGVGNAFAQTSGQTPSGQQSKDPFVERRNETTEAKRKYGAGEISKEEYQKKSAEANAKLKASGERGVFEQNLEVQYPFGTRNSSK